MKNKLKSLLIILITVASLVVLETPVYAAFSYTENGITYSLDDTTYTATIESYDISAPKDVVIPESVTYNAAPYSITSIGSQAFSEKQLTSVALPNSLTSIGEEAFFYNNLTSIIIPDGVTSIGARAFQENQLTTANIPDSITNLGAGAFYRNQLTTVNIPSTITSLEDRIFAYNQLTNVFIPDSVTSVGDSSFYHNQLTSLTLPDSMTSIGRHAFSANQLTSIHIPNGVTNIGSAAFYYNQLTNVFIPDSVTRIENNAFQENHLVDIVIPNNVTSIGAFAFFNNQLTSVTLPNSLTSIGTSGFSYNPLVEFYIPHLVDMDATIAVLSQDGALAGRGMTTTTIKMYALDNINSQYTTDTLSEYTLDAGDAAALEVADVVMPQIKKYDVASQVWNAPDDESILASNPLIEWYQKSETRGSDTLVATGAQYAASSAGIYYAKINGIFQLGEIPVSMSTLPNEDAAHPHAELPKTGEHSNIIVGSILLISASVLLFTLKKQRKTNVI